MGYYDDTPLFSAKVNPASGGFQSEVFESLDAFATFIKDGVSSYAASIYLGAYSKVDLQKEDVAYEPLTPAVEYSELDLYWPDAGLTLDSAVRATGAEYKWTYRGLWCK
jgi:hypothetical protein